MNDQQKLSRGQFLALIGGMAVAAALFKFEGAKNMIVGVTKKQTDPVATGSYGNHTYGGKVA